MNRLKRINPRVSLAPAEYHTPSACWSDFDFYGTERFAHKLADFIGFHSAPENFAIMSSHLVIMGNLVMLIPEGQCRDIRPLPKAQFHPTACW